MKKTTLLLILLAMASCGKKENTATVKEAVKDSTAVQGNYYTETYRPQFHFTPESKWMNDPNGMVYYDGEYHLFYQHYPDSTVWGPMHWGHAVSKDLLKWEHLPIALAPDEHGYIFSGSAVIDKENTSGLGSKDKPAMIAIYTYHDPKGEKAGRNDYQTQGMAYSLDKGRTWKKYEANPVVKNPGYKDFRDPKVFWNDKNKSWTMTLVAGDHAEFYTSKDLKSWSKTGEFGKGIGAHGGVWECPDLFELKAEGSGESKWILFISINPGAPNGGSGTQYFVGNFDGKTFTTDQKVEKWVDLGTDNYAGVTFNDAPGGARIFIGWMNNWLYATKVPTDKWRSAMTLPRKLTLHKESGDYFLFNYPIEEFEGLVYDKVKGEKGQKEFSGDFSQTDITFNCKELVKNFKATFSNANGDVLTIGVDQDKKALYVDRQKSGLTDFDSKFSEAIHYYPITANKQGVPFRIILDKSSVEVFAGEGRYVMTDQIFPGQGYTMMKITDSEENVENVTIGKIKRVWKK